MRYALLAYMILFGLGIVAAVAAVVLGREAGEKDEPLIEHIIDAVTASVLLAGMIFIWRNMESPLLKSSWKLIAPLTGGLALWSSWRDRKEALKQGEGQKDPRQIAFTDYWTIVLLAPSIALNVWYAFR
jgi:hypothetical protein